jgi:hypothetical protein
MSVAKDIFQLEGETDAALRNNRQKRAAERGYSKLTDLRLEKTKFNATAYSD